MSVVTDVSSSSSHILLEPVEIVHTDGTKETVYVQAHDIEDSGKMNFRDQITLAYVIVGILSLSLGAYVTYMQIKKNKN